MTKFIKYKSDFLYLGVYLHNLGILLYGSLEIQLFKFLVYLGPIFYLYGLWTCRKDITKKKLPLAYLFLLVVSLLMWARFDVNGYNGGTVQDITGSFSMSLFLILLYNKKIFYLSQFRKWSAIASVTSLLFVFVFFDKLLSANAYAFGVSNNEGATAMAMAAIYLFMSCSVFLCIPYVSKRKWNFFSLVIIIVTVITAMTSGRRGYSVINIAFIVIFLLLYSINSRITIWKRILFLMSFLFFASFYYSVYKDSQLKLFFDRLETDSRSAQFESWDKEMNKNKIYWLCGKGVSGGYYDSDFCEIRPGIENGMRHMILKGGLLYFICYSLLSIGLVLVGFLKSSNKVMKGFSIYVLLLYMFVFVWGAPSFSFYHLYMWISFVWICDPVMRRMSDSEILKWLNRS